VAGSRKRGGKAPANAGRDAVLIPQPMQPPLRLAWNRSQQEAGILGNEIHARLAAADKGILRVCNLAEDNARVDEAIELGWQAIKKWPTYNRSYIAYGFALARKFFLTQAVQFRDQAMMAYDYSITLKPSVESYAGRGAVFANAGYYEDAAADYTIALSMAVEEGRSTKYISALIWNIASDAFNPLNYEKTTESGDAKQEEVEYSNPPYRSLFPTFADATSMTEFDTAVFRMAIKDAISEVASRFNRPISDVFAVLDAERKEATAPLTHAAPVTELDARDKVPAAAVDAGSRHTNADTPARLKWNEHNRPDENPAAFAWRAYAVEAAAGTLHMGVIRQDDRRNGTELADKLVSWLRSPANRKQVPEGFDIPTKPEWITRQAEAGKARAASRSPMTSEERVYNALSARRWRTRHHSPTTT
jgi:tetratricopeptide (TPR) repeat protein